MAEPACVAFWLKTYWPHTLWDQGGPFGVSAGRAGTLAEGLCAPRWMDGWWGPEKDRPGRLL